MHPTDLLLVGVWTLILVGGGAACALLHRLGVPRTYVRDLLHISAGSWVFGWPYWHSPVAATALPVGAFALLIALPRVARAGPLAKFRDAISDDDERWSGILLYVASFAAFTAVGVWGWRFEAAAALLALSLGDGFGGLVGRRFGRRRFQLPFAKPKSAEGTLTVFLAAAVGIWIAAVAFESPVAWGWVVAAAAAAALAEAVAPRASDNVLVPIAVCSVLAAAA